MSTSKRKTGDSDKNAVTNRKSSWISWQRALLVVIPLMIYGKTMRFDFADTDRLHITENQALQQGLGGIDDLFLTAPAIGETYRPLTMTLFAVEQAIFGSSAKWAHMISVLLYLILLQVLLTLVNKMYSGKQSWFALTAMLLFSLHPVHADIVAHVDNRHELLSMLLGVMAWNRFLDTEMNRGVVHYSVIFLISVLALLSGPGAIILLIMMPVSAWLVKGYTLSDLKPVFWALGGAMVLLGIMRYLVALDPEPADVILPLQNIMYSAEGILQKTATALALLFQYISLLAYPVTMSRDFSFADMGVAGWNSVTPFMTVALISALVLGAFKATKRRPEIGIALIFLVVSLLPASQIFLLTGSTVDKSLLFVPTLAFAWVLVSLVQLITEKLAARGKAVERWFSIGGLVVLLVLWNLTGIRVADWQDNLTLYKSGVAASPKSAVMHYNLGYEFLERSAGQSDNLLKEDFLERSVAYMDTSLIIYPENHKALYAKGVYYAAKADTASAISSYRKAIQLRASARASLNNLGVLYMGRMNYDSAYHYFNLSHQLKQDSNAVSNLAKLFYTMGLQYSNVGEITKAIDNYKKCLTYEPRNMMALNNLATIYANRNEFTAAQQYLFEALKANPNDVMVLENMAVISYLDKNMGQAIEYANRALKVDPSLKRCLAVLVDSYRAIGDEATAQKYKQQYDALQ
jgi:tetratricopeptide (TPR) repeat protein